jgi:translation initiation factor 2B subunit (eIF-2B alpha/beta/delta family)
VSDSYATEVGALAGDHLSPSSALAARASALLQEVARSAPERLPEVALGVARAQPCMAALIAVANVALRALEALGAPSVGPALAALQRGIDADRRAAAAALAAALHEPVRLVTTSASANVVVALGVLRAQDLLTEVVCSESRPLQEGTALARWLADQGYPVTLVADAALAEHLDDKSLFVVGTDAILPGGVVNKRGTRLYATWARLSGGQRYVLATRDKLYPGSLLPLFDNPQRAASELVQKPPAGLRVDNRAFDVTARELWSGIWIGGRSLAEAEAAGDHALAHGLMPLLVHPEGT